MFEDIKLKAQIRRPDRALNAANLVLVFRDSINGLRARAAALSAAELAELLPLANAARETITALELLLKELERIEEKAPA